MAPSGLSYSLVLPTPPYGGCCLYDIIVQSVDNSEGKSSQDAKTFFEIAHTFYCFLIIFVSYCLAIFYWTTRLGSNLTACSCAIFKNALPICAFGGKDPSGHSLGRLISLLILPLIIYMTSSRQLVVPAPESPTIGFCVPHVV